MTSLNQWLYQQPNQDLGALIESLAQVCTEICTLVRRGPLAEFQGAAGNTNVQGEDQQKLDVITNDMLIAALRQAPSCRAIASEEMDHAIEANPKGEFLVVFDPLDGSSNIDINMPTGTIFSVLADLPEAALDDKFLQAGTKQLAAGYVLYGTATILALTLGSGTHFFCLDPSTGLFELAEQNVSIAAQTQEFAINASNQRFWEAPMQQYIAQCLAGSEGARGKNFNMRWVAAMVGDVHRILCRGGVFSYPFDHKDPSKAGKLRLLYEANPMGFLIEQAGGKCTTARLRILEIEPSNLHQRVPVVLGSLEEVNLIGELHRQFDTKQA